MLIDAQEITLPVPLQLPSGRLNPDAVGWTRTPCTTPTASAAGHDAGAGPSGGSTGRS
ncbi:MAG: hypothetical protein NVV66_17135 [Cellulomonas sp.]|uniref:hypothetical protein n=1 Tax=Cellulomonas sp. TaxID=40001 RepID=UPI0025889C96|nr:hypothetical protein [Cellulomonas sp.]MCR6706331.1 hypothetical protein [Cellulomonas sp.]